MSCEFCPTTGGPCAACPPDPEPRRDAPPPYGVLPLTRDQFLAAGGPAFPTHGWADGLSVRDLFACHALAGLLSFSPVGTDRQMRPKEAAKDAYSIADAMLAERLRTANGD